MKNFKTVILSAIMVACSLNVFAEKRDNFIYNSEEVNGVMVGQTVYKHEGNTLSNYMKYSYKYDDSKRMIENKSLKWNEISNEWENDICIRYTYKGKSVTHTYYKWNKKKGEFQLVPEMTVTMDNINM